MDYRDVQRMKKGKLLEEKTRESFHSKYGVFDRQPIGQIVMKLPRRLQDSKAILVRYP